ncbi:MAG: hypothetical protein IJ247_07170 [Bacilli bacterium]|nr:hypothetical protein [Bacilli bacterium]
MKSIFNNFVFAITALLSVCSCSGISSDEERQRQWDNSHGVIPVVSRDGKTLTYGLYPQRNINDSFLVSALDTITTPESNGWYLYKNDYYAKVSATPIDSDRHFDNGTTIISDTTYWFKCEPIIWNVLSNTNGECYILSSVLLDAHCYYHNSTLTRTFDWETVEANNYEHSDIRSWLNTDFYNSAFALGNSHIQTTTVDNSSATTYSLNTRTCKNTEDKVFLPSYQDYINPIYGFSMSTNSTNTIYRKTTDWARARGAYYRTDASYLNNGYYWTRSPSSEYYGSAWYVDGDGVLRDILVSLTYHSVRPALTIKIA